MEQCIDNKVIFQLNVESYDLVKNYPADWYHKHKHQLYQLSGLDSNPPYGKMMISRYAQLAMPNKITASKTKIIMGNTMFDYIGIKKDYTSWHVNFADGDVFNYYGSGLLAQDELQVAEHPILANVLGLLFKLSKKDNKYDPNTRDYDVKPNPATPILIEGVERRLSINTLPSTSLADGIYGNLFATADWKNIEPRVTTLKKYTISNIIAMEAHPTRRGDYLIEQIRDIFITAYTAFSAAMSQTQGKVEIHTGDWGTGAYGGNKILTACLQLLAARAANVDLLVFHTLDKVSFEKTLLVYENILLKKDTDLSNIFNVLLTMKYKWGNSDGN